MGIFFSLISPPINSSLDSYGPGVPHKTGYSQNKKFHDLGET